MIRRMNDSPMKVNPSGFVTGETPEILVTTEPPDHTNLDPPVSAPTHLVRHRSTSFSTSSPATDEFV